MKCYGKKYIYIQKILVALSAAPVASLMRPSALQSVWNERIHTLLRKICPCILGKIPGEAGAAVQAGERGAQANINIYSAFFLRSMTCRALSVFRTALVTEDFSTTRSLFNTFAATQRISKVLQAILELHQSASPLKLAKRQSYVIWVYVCLLIYTRIYIPSLQWNWEKRAANS
jgi:hypothetical protein